ncbi:hypothetical protein EV186_103422 [Labedaea rhizosphaerae]|uniref:Signal transduction histidine kinase n=2 Tax=Labedaea rhizosphaerae TaxID=598644 RepID=A0A4V3CZB5_LABRH|nr:hypothetical protein EV186_103422 [Labedaea rhizosphaerae]
MRLALLGVVAVVQFGLCPRTLFGYAHRPMWLALTAFAALGLVTIACAIWVLRREPLPTAVIAVGTVVALAASVAASAALPPDEHIGAGDWPLGLVGWHLLLLLLDRVPLLLTALAAHLTSSVAQFFLAGGTDRGRVGTAAIIVFGAVTLQLAVVVFTRVLRRSTAQAVAAAAERDRQAIRVAVAEQWEQGQRAVFAEQLGEVLPLLAGLADGELDPRAAGTRQRCALAATQLRRLFAENDDVPDPLVHEVSACVDVAERRGLDVSLAVSGAAVDVPADVRRDLTGPVATTLSAARTRARVSVLRTDDEVRVAVVSDAGTGLAAASSAHVEVECGVYGEHTRMEARWRRTS